jgi:hypothetical protein
VTMGEVRCPRGHPVTSTRQVTPWVCDGNESGVHAVGRNRCDTCDYDLCDTCFAQKRSKQQILIILVVDFHFVE